MNIVYICFCFFESHDRPYYKALIPNTIPKRVKKHSYKVDYIPHFATANSYNHYIAVSVFRRVIFWIKERLFL